MLVGTNVTAVWLDMASDSPVSVLEGECRVLLLGFSF